jgi:hypothetical protein
VPRPGCLRREAEAYLRYKWVNHKVSLPEGSYLAADDGSTSNL